MSDHLPPPPRRARGWRSPVAFLAGAGALLAPGPAVNAAAPTEERAGPVTQLPPLKVIGQPVTSFGLALCVFESPKTRQVARLFVFQVAPGSDGEAHGVVRGHEIVTIDGRPATSFAARFDQGTDLHRLLCNRQPGDRITLELTFRGKEKRTVVLTQPGRPRPPLTGR